MAVEIERKFLVQGEAWREEIVRSAAFRQGYLSGEGGSASVRVRLEGEEARLNIKAAVMGRARAEYEYPIPVPDAMEMLDGLCGGRVEKTRHYVERDGLVWEIDEFIGDNAGLIVAEIELADEQQEFPLPAWLGREVTDERRYYNHSLALHPFRSWNVS